MAAKPTSTTKKANATLSNLFKNRGDWVRDIASSFFSDALSLAGREVILNAMRDKKKPSDEDLDAAHGKLPEADQSSMMAMMTKLTEYAEAINASADPEDVKKRKIEEFKKLLLSDLKSKKDDKSVEPKRTKDFNEVLDSLDDETGQRFVFWFSLLVTQDQEEFNRRKADVTVSMLKHALGLYVTDLDKIFRDPAVQRYVGEVTKQALSLFFKASEVPQMEIGRFADIVTSLEPGQMAKYQVLSNLLTLDQEKALTDAGDRIPKKVFLAALERVDVGKKREAEDFCAFRMSLDASIGDRYDLFESKLPVAERGRLNAIRTWLTKDALKMWLPSAKECSPDTSVASLEQFELYVTERKAAAAVAFGPAEATKVVRFILANANPVDPSRSAGVLRPDEVDALIKSVNEALAAWAKSVHTVIVRNLPPAPKAFENEIQDLVKKVKDGKDALGKALSGLMSAGISGVDVSKLPSMKKAETKDTYFDRIKGDFKIKAVAPKTSPADDETDDACRLRLKDAIEIKDAERKVRIRKWLESGKKLADMPDPE